MAGDRMPKKKKDVPCIWPQIQAAFDWRRDRGWLSLSELEKVHTPPQNTASTAIRPKNILSTGLEPTPPHGIKHHQGDRCMHCFRNTGNIQSTQSVQSIRPIQPIQLHHPKKRPDDPFATRQETRRPSLPQFSGRMVNPHGNTMSPGCLSLTKLSEISSSSASSTTRMSLDARRP